VIGRFALAYAAWAVGIALAFWAVTSLHGLAMGLYVLLRLGPWGVAAYQNGVFLVLVIAWLAWVVATEHLLRSAASEDRLGRALPRILVPIAALAAVTYGALRLT
jgi:hypothetical protein